MTADPAIFARVLRQVAQEWARAGKLHVPPDNPAGDNDLDFWREVDRRVAEVAAGEGARGCRG